MLTLISYFGRICVSVVGFVIIIISTVSGYFGYFGYWLFRYIDSVKYGNSVHSVLGAILGLCIGLIISSLLLGPIAALYLIMENTNVIRRNSNIMALRSTRAAEIAGSDIGHRSPL